MGPAQDSSPLVERFEAALACADRQDWAGAEAGLSECIALDPSRSGPWLQRAWARLMQARPQEALADLDALLLRHPQHGQGLGLRGRTRLQQGELAAGAADLVAAWRAEPSGREAAAAALQAQTLLPGEEAQAVALAVEVAAQGVLDEPALRQLLGLLALHPQGPTLISQLWEGLLAVPAPADWAWEGALAWCLAQQQTQAALALSLRWLQACPQDARPARELGRLLAARGDYEAALPLLLQAAQGASASDSLELMELLVQAMFNAHVHQVEAGTLANLVVERHPQEPRAWLLRGRAMLQLHETALALADFRQAVALDAACPGAVCNLARALGQDGRPEEGLALLEQHFPLAALPPHLESIHARGELLRLQGRLAEAEALLRATLSLGHHPSLAGNLAYLVLLQGRYEEGLPLLADRDWAGLPQDRLHAALRRGATPWQGDVAQLRGRRLLVLSQNGIGDTVQFARFLPGLIGQGAQVALQAPRRTGELLASLHPQLQVFEEHETPPDAELVTDVHSLPGLLRLGLHQLQPRSGPILHADPARVRAMALSLGPARGLRVAVCWRGTRSNLVNRSLDLQRLADLALPGIEWLSLQYGPLEPEDLPAAERLGLRHESWSFADAAAAMVCADLVLSIDTVHAHIAASLGRPTWILLPFVPDWRWGTAGEDCPWYRSATLLRQQALNDWSAPLQQVGKRLGALAQAWRPSFGTGEAGWQQWREHGLAQASASGEALSAQQLGPLRAAWVRDALRRQQPQEAVRCCLDWLAEAPQQAQAAQALVACLEQTDELPLAAPLLLAHRQLDAAAAHAGLAALSDTQARRRALQGALWVDRLLREADPDNPAHALRLAEHLLQLQQTELAEPELAWVVQASPEDSPLALRAQLGQARLALLNGEPERGLQLTEAVRARLPADAPDLRLAWSVAHAVMLSAQRRMDGAELVLRQALSLQIDAQLWLALGLLRLLCGDHAQGMACLRSRERSSDFGAASLALQRSGARLWQQPGLQGLPGPRLAVTCEHGHGDVFQFARFLPPLAAAGVQVTLLARPEALELLREAMPAGVQVLPEQAVCEPGEGEPAPRFDAFCDVHWLPAQLDVRLETLAQAAPAAYLSPAPARCAQVAQTLRPLRAGRRRIGLAWQGQPLGPVRRSLALPELARHLAGLPGIDWVSLQPEPAQQAQHEAVQALDLQQPAWSFADLAAGMASLDLVISVDTAMAHLAGALGRPCWVLLPHLPDWRWGLDAAHTPWYPQARLFRQQAPGQWEGVLQQLRRALREEFGTAMGWTAVDGERRI